MQIVFVIIWIHTGQLACLLACFLKILTPTCRELHAGRTCRIYGFGWFPSIWCPLVESIFLQIVEFHSFKNRWTIFHCIQKLHFLYPFIWWCTSWVIPDFDYCERCYCDHGGASTSDSVCSGLLDVCTVVGLLNH